jgi:hypothetical protein
MIRGFLDYIVSGISNRNWIVFSVRNFELLVRALSKLIKLKTLRKTSKLSKSLKLKENKPQ